MMKITIITVIRKSIFTKKFEKFLNKRNKDNNFSRKRYTNKKSKLYAPN